jgi:hypothetical protein
MLLTSTDANSSDLGSVYRLPHFRDNLVRKPYRSCIRRKALSLHDTGRHLLAVQFITSQNTTDRVTSQTKDTTALQLLVFLTGMRRLLSICI